MSGKIFQVITGLILIIVGAFFTFKPTLTYQKESLQDFWAVLGIVLMIAGVVLATSPLFR